MKKKAIQVYIENKQNQALNYLAAKMKTSKASLIRRSINIFLSQHVSVEEDSALEIVGIGGKVTVNNLSEKHDSFLAKTNNE